MIGKFNLRQRRNRQEAEGQRSRQQQRQRQQRGADRPLNEWRGDIHELIRQPHSRRVNGIADRGSARSAAPAGQTRDR